MHLGVMISSYCTIEFFVVGFLFRNCTVVSLILHSFNSLWFHFRVLLSSMLFFIAFLWYWKLRLLWGFGVVREYIYLISEAFVLLNHTVSLYT